jgi:predicted RNase H-related nuclease YkuK (DUF458 family)
MSKEEIIKRIIKETGCSEEKAKIIFDKAIENKDIIVKLDWEYVINRAIIVAVIVTGLWALWRHIG